MVYYSGLFYSQYSYYIKSELFLNQGLCNNESWFGFPCIKWLFVEINNNTKSSPSLFLLITDKTVLI